MRTDQWTEYAIAGKAITRAIAAIERSGGDLEAVNLLLQAKVAITRAQAELLELAA